jgi:hypothetical protein
LLFLNLDAQAAFASGAGRFASQFHGSRSSRRCAG